MYYLDVEEPIQHFQETINSSIYVDKSLLIEKLCKNISTTQKYICITRPRRFGKTINAKMLAAYYTTGYDSRSLFDTLQIAKTPLYEEHLNKHHVIYIDFSDLPKSCDSYTKYIRYVESKIAKDMKETYHCTIDEEEPVQQLFSKSKDKFIFILDEWDSIFYKKFMTDADKAYYLEFLKGLLKDKAYVELAYMTGVLPVAKYASGSELNMFREYNFMNDHIYENYFGFNEKEVRKLCDEFKTISYETLKYWYDGYFLQDGTALFNPRSVSYALSDGVCLNYWTETGPMDEIAICIENNVDAVREDIVKLVADISIEVDLSGYSAAELQLNSRDEILSAMVVYGFLSYHDGYIRIPNYELMQKFEKVLSRESMGEVAEVIQTSKKVLEATIEEKSEDLARYIEEAHDREIPFLKYNDENSISCVITLCYLYARKKYDIKREEKSGKGYVDYLFKPRRKSDPAIILELKYGHSAQDAIEQIKQKNYMEQVKDCEKIILVGINYDKQSKKHTCRIEAI